MAMRRKRNSGGDHDHRATGPESDSERPPRLQKVLAAAGIASRRECENLILEGRVEIDGQPVTELGVRVDANRQEIRVDGDLLKPPGQVYFIVNKPEGVVSTNRDPDGRLRVIDLVPSDTRLFTVGRLDKSSEGLMLVTNDGELANRLAHPRYGVEKIYRVTVSGHPDAAALARLRQGVHLAEGVVRVKRLTVKAKKKNTAILELVLTEGRNREIRRMAASIGHKVLQLKRIALGPLRLGEMPPGSFRPLTREELRRLRSMTQPRSPSFSAPPGKRRNQQTTQRSATKAKTEGRSPASHEHRSGSKKIRKRR